MYSQVLRHIADPHREEYPDALERVYKNLLDLFYTKEKASPAVKDSTTLLKGGEFHLN